VSLRCFACAGPSASMSIDLPSDPAFTFYFCSTCFWSSRAAEAIANAKTPPEWGRAGAPRPE